MAWEISHTADAWGTAYENLCDKPINWLAEALATDKANQQEKLNKLFWDACWTLDIDDSNIDAIPDWQTDYQNALDQFAAMNKQFLVDGCFAAIERNQTCSNGGWEFYVDEGGHFRVEV